MSGSDANKPGAEPSMDDILASIRKILNEDDAPGAPASIPEPPAEPLMLTEEMLVAEPASTVVTLPAAPEPAPPPPAPPPPPPPPAPLPPAPLPPTPPAADVVPPPGVQIMPPPSEPRPAAMPTAELLAPAAAAAAAASMGQLLRAVTQERGSLISRGGPSIEDVVREELRPLLKEWLDNHLPGIVERAVRLEIERVASRGG
jgi:cell pole-organizing protein PopZ